MSLDVSEQGVYRKALLDALPNREPVWLMFSLRYEEDERISVYVAQGPAHGLRVGTIGPRNLDRLKAQMDGNSAKMKGLIEWSSSTPKVKFIPEFSLR